jgi:leader peptidase (prepilin peptidase)/N-methyltransferase
MDSIIYTGFTLLGLAVGSFLNLCIDRLPGKSSIISPGSHCDKCGQQLKPADLIPIISYIWLRGRCRYCHSGIPVRVLIVEITTGALFPLLVWNYGLELELAAALVYICVFILIFFIDIEHKLILNTVILPAIAVAFIFSFFWSGFEEFWPQIGPGITLSALLGGAAGFTLLLLPYLITRGGMGAGDVKLAGLIGMVNGFPLVLVALFCGIVAGGLLALILLISRMVGRKDAIPFGPFLVLGSTVSLIWGEGIIDWYNTSLMSL